MAHVREEAATSGRRSACSELGVLVELGVEGDDAAVGLLELAVVQLADARAWRSRSSCRCGAAPGSAAGARRAGPAALPAGPARPDDPSPSLAGPSERPPALGSALPIVTVGPAPGRRLDLEPVHQPPRADDPQPQAGRRRRYRPSRIGLEVLDPRPPLADADHAGPAAPSRPRPGTRPCRRPRTGRRCGRSPRPPWRSASGPAAAKPEQAGDLAGALPRQDDVGLEADLRA